MSTPIPGHNAPTLRLLILDGTPGATTLLVLAVHGALPRPDIVLIPDTGWYPATTYKHLDRLVHLATSTGIEVVWVDAGAGTQAAAHDPSMPCPLPLHIRTPDGTFSRLRNGCAERQTEAIDSAVRFLLGYPEPCSVPDETIAECVLGLGAEHAALALPAESSYRRDRYPLVELGWRTEDCRAHLTMHDLSYQPDVACVACPNRRSVAWAELRATDPPAWNEAVAVDADLRHRASTAAQGGMPPGTTGYLHPSRVALADVDLDAAPDAGSEACVPSACRGNPGTGRAGGGAA